MNKTKVFICCVINIIFRAHSWKLILERNSIVSDFLYKNKIKFLTNWDIFLVFYRNILYNLHHYFLLKVRLDMRFVGSLTRLISQCNFALRFSCRVPWKRTGVRRNSAFLGAKVSWQTAKNAKQNRSVNLNV